MLPNPGGILQQSSHDIKTLTIVLGELDKYEADEMDKKSKQTTPEPDR